MEGNAFDWIDADYSARLEDSILSLVSVFSITSSTAHASKQLLRASYRINVFCLCSSE
jgi:hypothetical protein